LTESPPDRGDDWPPYKGVMKMYTVHPRNLTLGPFLTLLLTLSHGKRIAVGPTRQGVFGCRLLETAPANAHDGALREFVVKDLDQERPPVVLGPFLTLIFTVKDMVRRTEKRKETAAIGRTCCRRPQSSGDTTS
jgi:hypothetical protein